MTKSVNNKIKRALGQLTSLCTASLFSLNALATTIDLMVVHTQGVTERYNGEPETRIQHLVNVANQVYLDSNVDLQLRVVHTHEVNYSETNNSYNALVDITTGNHPAFSNVEALRQEHGADMVILYRPFHPNHGSCGIAWIGGWGSNGDFSADYHKGYAYSHTAIDTCADYVTTHELGHNMGLGHSHAQNSTGR